MIICLTLIASCLGLERKNVIAHFRTTPDVLCYTQVDVINEVKSTNLSWNRERFSTTGKKSRMLIWTIDSFWSQTSALIIVQSDYLSYFFILLHTLSHAESSPNIDAFQLLKFYCFSIYFCDCSCIRYTFRFSCFSFFSAFALNIRLLLQITQNGFMFENAEVLRGELLEREVYRYLAIGLVVDKNKQNQSKVQMIQHNQGFLLCYR